MGQEEKQKIKKESLSIKDIAKIANVSTATISRVLNDTPGVSEKERVRIKKILEGYEYQPNLLGQNLRNKTTKTLLAIVPTLANLFYAKILSAMEDEAAGKGYALLVCERPQYIDLYLNRLRSRLIDGVAIFYANMTGEEINKLAKQYPVVQCCDCIEDSKTSYSGINDQKAGREVGEYLMENGHKRIAFLGEPASSDIRRLAGLTEAMTEKGLERPVFIRPIRIPEGDSMPHVDAQRLKEIMTDANHPTAIFCASDDLAIQLMNWMQKNNYSVPEDISIIGFDDQESLAYFKPYLSSVLQNQEEIGRNAVDILLRKIQDRKTPDETVYAGYELKARETVLDIKEK